MKNIRIIFTIAVMSLLVMSCDKTEPTVFNPETGETLAFFNNPTSNLEVIVNNTGVDTIKVGLTTLAQQDRTITVSLIDSLTTADAANYTLESNQVVVPAGEYFGNLVINGTDTSLEIQPELIALKLESISTEGIVSQDIHTVSIFQICPIEPTSFIGDYMLTQLTPDNPDDGAPVFSDQIINLSLVEGASTKRQFSAVYLEDVGIGQPAMTVSFALSCGQVIVDPGLDTQLTCDQESNITLGPAEVPATFDSTDDSYFELTLTEYENDGGCGVAPYQVTFSLTKQ